MTEVPENVWVVQTELSGKKAFYYAAVSSEQEAIDLTGRKAVGEPIFDAKQVRNVDNVASGDFMPVPTDDPYSGGLIP